MAQYVPDLGSALHLCLPICLSRLSPPSTRDGRLGPEWRHEKGYDGRTSTTNASLVLRPFARDPSVIIFHAIFKCPPPCRTKCSSEPGVKLYGMNDVDPFIFFEERWTSRTPKNGQWASHSVDLNPPVLNTLGRKQSTNGR